MKKARFLCGLLGVALLSTGMPWTNTEALANNGVSVLIERTPAISSRASGPVKVGNIHILEESGMGDTMLEGDFIDIVLPDGVVWNDRTRISLETRKGTYKYEEDEEYHFSGDRYLSISLSGVTSGRDTLIIEPYVELDGFKGGPLNISISGDLIGIVNEDIGQAYNYGVEVSVPAITKANAGEKLNLGPIILEEACAGSFKMNEDVEISLPEGFILKQGTRTAKVTLSNGSKIFDTMHAKNDNTAILPVEQCSVKPVRAEIVLQDVTIPTDFSGDLTIRVKGQVFDENVVLAEISPIKESKANKTDEIIKEKESSADKNAKNTAALKLKGSFQIDNQTATIDRDVVLMETAPYIKDGYTYLPVRYVAYALGIDSRNIVWNAQQQTITLTKGATTVGLTVGSTKFDFNNVSYAMTTAPEIRDNITMLPIRSVVEAFGGSLEWDSVGKIINVYIAD